MVEKESAVDPEIEERDDAVIGYALRWSLVVIIVLALTGGGIAVWLIRPEPEISVTEANDELPDFRKRPQTEAPALPLIDITQAAGIDFQHENGATGDKLLPETMGAGCAFFDFDGDEDQDLLLVNSRRWPWDERPPSDSPTLVLYANDGAGHLQDVTAAAGLGISIYGTGVAVGDYDNDGDRDVFVTAVGPNRLFRNDGGTFADVTERAGVAGEENAWGTSCGFFDYNNDGLLDLFVANYIRWSREIDSSQNFQLVGVGRAYGPPTAFEGSFPYLYRNDGGGKFTDVSAAAGIQVTNPATGVPMAKSMGIVLIDLDRDSWMDVIVANDTVQNFLFHNQQDGTFREIGALAGVAFDAAGDARGAMGIDAAYYRNDDTMAIGVGNFANEMTAFYCASDSPLQFVDTAIANGLGPATRLELTFGLFFFDCDLDGRLDVLAANGHLEEEINRVQVSQFYEQPPQLFWNCGPQSRTEFVPLLPEQVGSDFHRRMVGRGAAFADVDGDHDVDILLTSAGGRPRLLRNDQQLGNHWLRFVLTGSQSNRDAIGAWVEVRAGDAVFRRQVMPTRSYLSQCELPVTIGLGQINEIDEARVIWPDGSIQLVELTEVDHVVQVVQRE
jgi:hypothetical protein